MKRWKGILAAYGGKQTVTVEGQNVFGNILGGKWTFLRCRYAGTTLFGEAEIAVCDFGVPAHLR